MNNFINKNFRRNETVKIFLIKPDKRILIKYVIPSNNIVNLLGYSFNLIEDKMFYSNGFPAYFCSYKSAEPIDPNDYKKFVMTATDYNTAISANVAKEIFAVTRNKLDMQLVSIVLSVLCLVGLVLIYMQFQQSFENIINNLPKNTLPVTTGGY